MTAILQLDGATVRFGGVTAVDNVSFEIARGGMTGLIGPNGAGKTTCMRMITGVVRPNAGRVLLDGTDVTTLPTHARVRLGLGLSQQLVSPFRGMTPVENVMLAAGKARTRRPLLALCQRDRSEERTRALALLDLVGIAEAAEARPTALPLGYLKRLEVARALALEPKLLLLDEPLAGLNHVEATAMADTIAGLTDNNLTIVLIEHNLGEVMRVCPRLIVLDNGRKIGDGEARAVLRDPTVRAAYIGDTHAAA